jgi:hypothetical protein
METIVDIRKIKLPPEEHYFHEFFIGKIRIASISEMHGWGITYDYKDDRSLESIKIEPMRHWISLTFYGDKDPTDRTKYNSFDEAKTAIYDRLPVEARVLLKVKTHKSKD